MIFQSRHGLSQIAGLAVGIRLSKRCGIINKKKQSAVVNKFSFSYCNGTDGPLHCQRCGSPRPRRNDAQADRACGPKRRLPAGHFSLASTWLVARIKMNLTAGNLHHQQLRNKANLNITGKILTQTAAKHMRTSCMLE